MSKRKLKFKDEMNVIVKPLAYYKMLVHVLRFGNKVRDPKQFKEVMGMLIGCLEGVANNRGVRNVIVEDAVPVSHGGSIEVAFAPEDYVSFAMVDEQFSERNLFTVGWYHSHPGLRIFFSGTDIKNQLGWQTPNPSAIGIVFDHTYLETSGDLGFRTFRLDDPSKGPKSEYHEVNTTVEPPDNIEFYFKLMELINSIHNKEAPVLEINETLDPFGEIILPEKNQLLSRKPELQLTKIFSALQEGLSKFLTLSIEPLILFLNSTSQEIIKNIINNNLQMRSDLIELKDNLTRVINNLQNSFKFSLTDNLNQLDIYIDDKFEDLDKNREIIKNIINKLKEEIVEQLNKLFKEKIEVPMNEILKLFDEGSNILTEINQKNENISKSLEEQNNSINNLFEKIKSIKILTLEKLKSRQDEIMKALTDKIISIVNGFNNLNNQNKDFLSNLDASTNNLENSTQNLQKQIEQFKNDNDNLKKQLEDLDTQNHKLLEKIKKLEGGNE